MANWYVSQKVAASGVGSSLATAFKTFAEAHAAASDNDTIYVYAGVYNEGNFSGKDVIIRGIGEVVFNGTLTLASFYTMKNANGAFRLYNCKLKNYTGNILNFNYKTGGSIYLYNNYIKGGINATANSNLLEMIGNVITGSYVEEATWHIFTSGRTIKNNIFGSTFYCFYNTGDKIYNNNFRGNTYMAHTDFENIINNNFESTSAVKFTTGASYANVNSAASLAAKVLADRSVVLGTATKFYTTTLYVNDNYNNEAKENFTLKETSSLIVGNNKNYIGANNMAANIICKGTASSGDCDIYNIGTDAYSLGLFGGVTNVGTIDNTNQKLYRSSTGANNWGVFVANTEFTRTRIVKNWLGFGGMVGTLGQTSENPSDWANHYNVDVLVKWSATLSKAALLAETSIPFVKLRYRPNETNYYVDNSGTLVGDGDSGYQALVSSADTDAAGAAGGGALVPQRITAKSIVAIIILRDL